MGQIFIFSFITVAFIYAFLASMTTLFYRNKFASDLSNVEWQISVGKASISERVGMFFLNLFWGIITPLIYILAGILTSIAYLFVNGVNQMALINVGVLVVVILVMWRTFGAKKTPRNQAQFVILTVRKFLLRMWHD